MKTLDFDTADNVISYGKMSAFCTFLIGTFILGTFYLYQHSSIIFVSLFYMVVASFVNGFIFIKLISFWFSNPNDRKEIRNILLFMLLNIPIAYIYVRIGLEIYSDSFSIQ